MLPRINMWTYSGDVGSVRNRAAVGFLLQGSPIPDPEPRASAVMRGLAPPMAAGRERGGERPNTPGLTGEILRFFHAPDDRAAGFVPAGGS
jgi:hypothetical protein